MACTNLHLSQSRPRGDLLIASCSPISVSKSRQKQLFMTRAAATPEASDSHRDRSGQRRQGRRPVEEAKPRHGRTDKAGS
ncbi:hypothetical protein AAFF_G00016970 [Aldrovandia affinis]|uniref:Uncharacterized protein n=1 Tax=Aldrovandia affinis TaxID=143900 RepID=A0AAD7S616_9TELE|nr:hypothetical protein AAFF_G00016970 [Aldrovandia affinis]